MCVARRGGCIASLLAGIGILVGVGYGGSVMPLLWSCRGRCRFCWWSGHVGRHCGCGFVVFALNCFVVVIVAFAVGGASSGSVGGCAYV